MTRAAVSSSVETLLVPLHYRGRLSGYIQREDVRGAMATLSRLDRLAARAEAEGRTAELRELAEQFDEPPHEGDKGDTMGLANGSTLSPSKPSGLIHPFIPYPLP